MNIYESGLTNVNELIIGDQAEASVETWQGHKSLCLNGLVVVPNSLLSEGSVDVYIGSSEASYCGIAFRIRDTLNYELAYAQPHTSGRWDALQYDPVFHGSNTWQLYHGPCAQQTAEVPLNEWFHLRVEFKDQRAVIHLNGQPPLIVPHLAHAHGEGLIGLWSYRPAYFRDLRISGLHEVDSYTKETIAHESEGVIKEWFLQGYGCIEAEKNGNMNLNRFLPSTVPDASLTRRFVLREPSAVTLNFGFSDEITILVDESIVFEGDNTFKASPEWNDQGYVDSSEQIVLALQSGVHKIEILLKRTELFGFGFNLSLHSDHYELLSCGY